MLSFAAHANMSANKASSSRSLPTLKPRKKFDLKDEIKTSTMRFSRQQEREGWEFKTNQRLANRISQDLIKKRLFVQGTEMPPFNFCYDDVIKHLAGLPEPKVVDDDPSQTKLRMTPVFGGYQLSTYSKTIPPGKSMTAAMLLNRYEECELRHKTVEDHHPGSDQWRKKFNNLNNGKIVEAIFDLLASLLRTMNFRAAWKKMFEILEKEPYNKMEPSGLYYALMHIFIRGLSKRSISLLHSMSVWRKQPLDKLIADHKKFEAGYANSSLFSYYRSELDMHCFCINQELVRLRINKVKHDFSKWEPQMVYFYTWRWGIWEQLPAVVKSRALAGCDDLNPPEDRFTGLYDLTPSAVAANVGKEFANQVDEMLSVHSDGLDDKIEHLGDRLEKTGERISEELSSKIEVSLENVSTSFVDRARILLNDMFSKGKTVGVEMADEFARKAKDVLGDMPKSLENISGLLDNLKNFVNQSISGIRESFGKFIPAEIKIDVESILNVLKYYILMTNVENSFLRAVLFLLMLHSIGALTLIHKHLMRIIAYLFGTNDEEPPNFTSGEDWITKIFSNFKIVLTVLSGTLASVFSGKTISKLQFGSLIKTLSETLKPFHFIAQGTKGLLFIFESVKKLFMAVLAWVNQKIFGVNDPKKELAKKVILWCMHVRYFSTEAGMNMIRLSPEGRRLAEKLYTEGQALQLEVSSTGDSPCPHLQRDIARHWRDVKVIENFLNRRKAMTEFQPTMFHIQMVGQAGIGKSTLTKELVNQILSVQWEGKHPGSFWAYNPNLEFFDGYAGQKIMIVDDIFRYNEPKHLTTLIGLITNTPIILPMANLEDKGTQMTSEIMLSSTNCPYPMAKDIYCMEAVFRRRHMLVHVTCDDRVRSKTSGAFDQTLFEQYYPGQNSTDFPHLKFSLLKPVPLEMDRLEYEEEEEASLRLIKEATERLNTVNRMANAGKEIPLDYFYMDSETPAGCTRPCRDWSFQQFVANCAGRFAAFRTHERAKSITAKYDEAIERLVELDAFVGDALDQGKIPSVPIIKDLLSKLTFCDTSDEVRELETRILQGENPAPELDGISLEQIICEATPSTSTIEVAPDIDPEELFKEQEFKFLSPDLLTSDERPTPAMRRINAIRRRIVNSRPPDPILHKATFVPGKGILLDNEMTSWDEHFQLGLSDWKIGYCRNNHAWAKWVLSQLNFKESVQENDKFSIRQFLQSVDRDTCSRWMTIPDTKEFSDAFRGKKTAMSIYFLQNVEFHDGRAYFMQDKFPITVGGTAVVHHNKIKYEIERDEAYFWSFNENFRIFVTEFSQYVYEQQLALVREARWRNRYTGFYTIEKLKEFYTSSLVKYPLEALRFVTSPLYHFWEFNPLIFTVFFTIAAAWGAIYLLKQVASLFYPQEKHTSRINFRGPPSTVKYSKASFTSSIIPLSGNAVQQTVSAMMRRNVRKIIISNLNNEKTCTLHCLCNGQFIIFNKHALLHLDTGSDFQVSMSSPDGRDTWDFIVKYQDLYQDPKGDLAIMHSKYFPASRSIDGAFLSEKEWDEMEINRELVFLSTDNEHYIVSQHQFLQRVRKEKTVMGISMNHFLVAKGSTLVGNSGSTVVYPVAVNGRIPVLGIQAWELDRIRDAKIAIQVITQEKYQDLIDNLLSQMEELPIIRTDDYVDEEFETIPAGFTSQQFNNLVCHVPRDEALGMVGKTAFKKTPIASLMDRDGFESARVPAVLNPNDQNLAFGKEIHPLSKSFNKYFKGKVKVLDEKLLSYIEDSFVTWFSTKLDKKKFRVLEFEEIITGTREDGSNPMALNTSPGIPYVHEKREKKGKRDYFEISEEGNLSYFDPEIKEDFESFEQEMRAGRLPLTCSYDFPKDELRPRDKALGNVAKNIVPSTRTVTCMNMMYTMLWRKLTLDLWAAFHRAADGTFPFCPGINPEGPEWSEAFHYLNQQPNAVDLDVANWDGFALAQLIFSVGRIICRLLQFEVNSPEELCIRAILTELIFSYIQHGTTIFQKYRGMISGFPGTAEVNTLIHMILSLYIYLVIMTGTGYEYFQAWLNHVCLLIYGDDKIETISDEIIEIYNGISISNQYLEIGYPVTPADKSSCFQKSKTLLECSFLKSTWRHMHSDVMIRQMDISVAYDLLYWVRAKQQPLGQFYDNLVDALHIVFGHGKKRYNQFLTQLNNWLIESGNPPVLIYYRDLYDDHMRKYYLSEV